MIWRSTVYYFVIMLEIIGLSVFRNAAHASVIEADSRLGNASAFIDTNTGIQWLDLSVTFNQSIDDISTEFRDGGRYEGFRYASLDEVNVLLAGLGLQFSTGETKSHVQFQLLENFLIMMGVPSGIRCCDAAKIRPVYGLTGTLAQSPNPGDPTQFFWASFLQTTENGYAGSPPNVYYNAAWVEPQSTRIRSDSVPAAFMGSWLIWEVPEPSSILLVFSGFLCLLWAVNRKEKNGPPEFDTFRVPGA